MTNRAEQTKQRILAAAELEFSEKGLYGARVDEIALRAMANKRMIYAYFGSKEQLYVAVLEEVYGRMAAFETPFLACTHGGEEETIRALIRHYFNFLHETPTFVRIVMWENLNRAEYLRLSRAAHIKGGTLQLLRETLETGVENGTFRTDIDVEETVLSIQQLCFAYFSNIHTFTQLVHRALAHKEETQKRAEHVADMILRYLSKTS